MIETVISFGKAYQFPTAICDDAGNEFIAAAAVDLSHILIVRNGTDWDKIQPGGRVQAPTLYHSGTELRIAFQSDQGGWHVSREKYANAYVVATGGTIPNPTPTPVPTDGFDPTKWKLVFELK